MARVVLDFGLQVLGAPASGGVAAAALDARDMADACGLRQQAYARHVAKVRMERPDAIDRLPETRVLLVRGKADGQALGTVRLQRNHPAPMALQSAVQLPEMMMNDSCAEVTRLAVAPGAPSEVRLLLFKACYLLAQASQVHWLVVGARSTALVRMYRLLGFTPLTPPDQPALLPYACNLPHHVLALDVVAAERLWHRMAHPLYDFMLQTWHPDLVLEPGGRPAWWLCGAAAPERAAEQGMAGAFDALTAAAPRPGRGSTLVQEPAARAGPLQGGALAAGGAWARSASRRGAASRRGPLIATGDVAGLMPPG